MGSEAIKQMMQEARGLHLAGRLGEAEVLYRRILEGEGNQHAALHGLGVMALQVNRPGDALRIYQQAIRLDGTQADYWVNMGEALRQLGRVEESIRAILRGCQLAPGHPDPVFNFGRALMDRGDYGAASEAFLRVLAMSPNDHEAMNNLGNARLRLGLAAEAMEWFSRAMKLSPDPGPRGNFLLMMNCLPYSRGEISAAHRAFGKELEGRTSRMNIPPRGRHERIRVGYLSSCFRKHAAARFLITPLKMHDRSRFEIFVYSTGGVCDEMTSRMMGLAEHWLDISRWSDDKAAGRILADEIDILVDIDGLTAGNRIGILARKAAPIQVSWLGYQNTTGLGAVDYRITDGFVDPEGATDGDYAEKLERLERAFFCYETPDVDAAPVRAGDESFTFGSFNSLMKITPGVLEAWARILDRVPGSRLVIATKGNLADPAFGRLLAPFASRGVAGNRVELLGRMGYAEYLRTFQRVDVALDPFPCAGHTTTCDSIWMGVPTLTLAGEDYRSRLGVSVLSNVGLMGWIARDLSEYVEKAVEAARGGQDLRRERAMLRKRLEESAIYDAGGFTARLEGFYMKAMDEKYGAFWGGALENNGK